MAASMLLARSRGAGDTVDDAEGKLRQDSPPEAAQMEETPVKKSGFAKAFEKHEDWEHLEEKLSARSELDQDTSTEVKDPPKLSGFAAAFEKHASLKDTSEISQRSEGTIATEGPGAFYTVYRRHQECHTPRS
ncbi:hypothetical protein Bbelb_161920 [Branchiostoma belcheri]|nr:hypothetical protein Bbelb_161920 [Branchiostoma belcheri]